MTSIFCCGQTAARCCLWTHTNKAGWKNGQVNDSFDILDSRVLAPGPGPETHQNRTKETRSCPSGPGESLDVRSACR